MSNGRVARGRATQRILAAWYQTRIWPYATPRGAFEAGADLENTPGVACEIKATSGGPLLGALRQVRRDSGQALPYVVWRPNGYGPERIREWVVAMTLEDHTQLLLDAGYGQKQNGGAA